MITPTPGRIVWFHPAPGDLIGESGQPLAAIVTHVHDDRLVNLAVFGRDGNSWPRQRVRIAQDGDGMEAGMAQWMPYQTAQAAKYEAGGGAFGDLVKRVDALTDVVASLGRPPVPIASGVPNTNFSEPAPPEHPPEHPYPDHAPVDP